VEKRIQRNSFISLLVVTLLALISCGQNTVFDQYVTIPEGGWNMDSMAVFRVDIESTSQVYDVDINVRNRSAYPNSNLWLFVEITAPSGKAMNQKVDCILADDNGRWLGSGWGDLYHVRVPFQRSVKFAENGEYIFRIVHGMRKEALSGIHNIGLSISEAHQEENTVEE
jgi:gliding motility-associated lipoprotein GldH